ncbi:FAD-dependent oxidoreductase [Vibrio sp. TH_r3]|uniref:NAD(P)-binding protein n=1 Tax=Vibrio sp. TH_r3 TaxID=3082084 RepID=UPI002954CBCE|nr:NAD(P)-binding protein [Vibrio sp. TH_r3]MDV7103524.1 FAD-dependent oxidoreductase [Vibrio sp. TH_r3]
MNKTNKTSSALKIGIVGGGIAGATAAIKLAELGIQTYLFERKPSLVFGPPICHLHAGGNLYRDIDEQQCIDLLRQSIQSVKLFPHTINIRPTIIAVPKVDQGEPESLIVRLEAIQKHYADLITVDETNKVLGEPDQYYKTYSKHQLIALKGQAQKGVPKILDDWMIPFVNSVDLESLKYPVVLVQEYGWSLFRLASTTRLMLQDFANAQVFLSTEVTDIQATEDQWTICYNREETGSAEITVDYLVNACGYETGTLDNLVKAPRNRLVEFKAAYVTHWAESNDVWPEVIFHGERGTVDGMAQLTPYADGIFQLHGMTEDITLFKDGLVASDASRSAQPQLPDHLLTKLRKGWDKTQTKQRTELAIKHMSRFIPSFASASIAGEPLYGAQQIPGLDASLRSADVSFHGNNYARVEIVKGSSAIEAAMKIVEHLQESNIIEFNEPQFVTPSLKEGNVEMDAVKLAQERGYPVGLAKICGLKT